MKTSFNVCFPTLITRDLPAGTVLTQDELNAVAEEAWTNLQALVKTRGLSCLITDYSKADAKTQYGEVIPKGE